MSDLFISKDSIQSAHDWIEYVTESQNVNAPDILFELENLLKINHNKTQIAVPYSLLQSTLSWIHYERRQTGQDRPRVETEIQNILITVNKKEKQ